MGIINSNRQIMSKLKNTNGNDFNPKYKYVVVVQQPERTINICPSVSYDNAEKNIQDRIRRKEYVVNNMISYKIVEL